MISKLKGLVLDVIGITELELAEKLEQAWSIAAVISEDLVAKLRFPEKEKHRGRQSAARRDRWRALAHAPAARRRAHGSSATGERNARGNTGGVSQRRGAANGARRRTHQLRVVERTE